MIKRFEQYISETLNLKNFKFEDRFQSIFDSWENYINIVAEDGKIDFNFMLPDVLDGFDKFCDDIKQFKNDLKVILDTLDIDKIKYKLQILNEDISGNGAFVIRVYIYTEFNFNQLKNVLNKKDYALDILAFIDSENDWKKVKLNDLEKFDSILLLLDRVDGSDIDEDEDHINDMIREFIRGYYYIIDSGYSDEHDKYAIELYRYD